MPITYDVDVDQDVIYEHWSGTVDAAGLDAYWRDYLRDPQVLACRRTLVDLRGAKLAFTGEELRHLVRTTVADLVPGLSWTTAVVVESPVQMGVARQYQVFAESYSTDAIFEDEAAALAWLFEQPAPGAA